MNEQTEKLREGIADAHYRRDYIGRGLKEFIDVSVYLQNLYLAIADDDLKICKEAGLKFVEYTGGLGEDAFDIKEIELGE